MDAHITLSDTHDSTYSESTQYGKSLINNSVFELLETYNHDRARLESKRSIHDTGLTNELSNAITTNRKGKKKSGDLPDKRAGASRLDGPQTVYGVGSFHKQFSAESSASSAGPPLNYFEEVPSQQTYAPAIGSSSGYGMNPIRSQPFGYSDNNSSPQSAGVRPLDQYDTKPTVMNYMDITPGRNYAETYGYCDTETQNWLEALSDGMAHFDSETLSRLRNDEPVFRQNISSILNERSTIFAEVYYTDWEGKGKVLAQQIIERAITRRYEIDQQYHQQRQQQQQ
ncbi:uncharacterized protein I206_104446 [Kwoniella pini CBS 10737]|uniref:Uncharacterized protein n=1 Tax=Kwoniella pini CBS 10737 TaxID=1296096 RepID=A0A1B9I1P5_9TREE|nr:uncharacterized protein I206_03973 [Kwoniella pini CBS 10737]OCF49452.1 hypothetical protein I206_03973 [Kwoniella pini CBS 10737]